ncbi:MAG: hypothetical protein L0215_24690, partial [Gemmataceae bacterium]|nr:hypothetical protein [Gemmataceae bacterium]
FGTRQWQETGASVKRLPGISRANRLPNGNSLFDVSRWEVMKWQDSWLKRASDVRIWCRPIRLLAQDLSESQESLSGSARKHVWDNRETSAGELNQT